MTEAQITFWNNLWYRNVILKARQHGLTTQIGIFFLDTALWKDNTACGVIAHTLPDATEIFDSKICYPYDNLPEEIRHWRPYVKCTATRLEFNNGSSLRVGTSMRSGTVQMLHVSEFGKIAATRPDKAKEIMTGALEAVPRDGIAIFESTAEGMDGAYKDMCDRAQALQDSGKKLTQLDFKFHFFSWWANPEYCLPDFEAKLVVIDPAMHKYFDKIEAECHISLSHGQRAWYVKKEETTQDDMRREYPSTPEEAFAGAVTGAYYNKNMTRLRKLKRITKVPHDPALPVNTMWDLGYDDSMTLVFHQRSGKENHLIDYYENEGENFAHYVTVMRDRKLELGYDYGDHYLPHDSQVHDLSAERNETRREYLERNGVKPIQIVSRPKGQDEVLSAIQETREFLDNCWIDEERCAALIKGLDNYKKKWDDKRGAFSKTPDHTWASHSADALRTGAMGFKEQMAPKPRPRQRTSREFRF